MEVFRFGTPEFDALGFGKEIPAGYSFFMTLEDVIKYLIDNLTEENAKDTFERIEVIVKREKTPKFVYSVIMEQRIRMHSFSKYIISKYDEVFIVKKAQNTMYAKLQKTDNYFMTHENAMQKLDEIDYNSTIMINYHELRAIEKYAYISCDVVVFKRFILSYGNCYKFNTDHQRFLVFHTKFEIVHILEQRNELRFHFLLANCLRYHTGRELFVWGIQRVFDYHPQLKRLSSFCIKEIVQYAPKLVFKNCREIIRLMHFDKDIVEYLYYNNKMRLNKHSINYVITHGSGKDIKMLSNFDFMQSKRLLISLKDDVNPEAITWFFNKYGAKYICSKIDKDSLENIIESVLSPCISDTGYLQAHWSNVRIVKNIKKSCPEINVLNIMEKIRHNLCNDLFYMYKDCEFDYEEGEWTSTEEDAIAKSHNEVKVDNQNFLKQIEQIIKHI